MTRKVAATVPRLTTVEFVENNGANEQNLLYITVEAKAGARTGYRGIESVGMQTDPTDPDKLLFVLRLNRLPEGQRNSPAPNWTFGRLFQFLEMSGEFDEQFGALPMVFLDVDGREVEFIETGWQCGDQCPEDCGDGDEAETCETLIVCRKVAR